MSSAKLVRLTLTPEQYELLKPAIDDRWLDPERTGSIFMTVSCAYDPSEGKPVAQLHCATLPITEAGKVVNLIRESLGLPKKNFRYKKATRERVEKTSSGDGKTDSSKHKRTA